MHQRYFANPPDPSGLSEQEREYFLPGSRAGHDAEVPFAVRANIR